MWIIGIDEAGYGPNLGPFVMTSVACHIPEDAPDLDLWKRLAPTVRRCADKSDAPLLVDDSKLVYGSTQGLLGLERNVLAILAGRGAQASLSLTAYAELMCPDSLADMRTEIWYTGTTGVPVEVPAQDLVPRIACFTTASAAAGIHWGLVRSVVVCPPRFNGLLEECGSKGGVLAHGLTQLLRVNVRTLAGNEPLGFFIDKHGGRNTYAAMLQHALPDGMVVAQEEGAGRSAYRVLGLSPEVSVTFQPRADSEHFCVALASMASKYLRELLMLEFNRFWQTHVAGLKATAGYPGDAVRYLASIRPALVKLGVPESAVWRRK